MELLPRPTRLALASSSSSRPQPRAGAGHAFHGYGGYGLVSGISLGVAGVSRSRTRTRLRVVTAPVEATTDELVRYCGGNVVVRAVCASELVQQVVQQHGCSSMASIALGRAVLATILLANGRDEGERLQLRLLGSGPIGSIITEASSALTCRGMLGDPQAEAATVPELLGEATLRLTRTHPYWKRPYTGTIQVKSGEIAEDVVQYLSMSEQTPASMGLSVQLDEQGKVKEAEGWLVTLLPGAELKTIIEDVKNMNEILIYIYIYR